MSIRLPHTTRGCPRIPHLGASSNYFQDRAVLPLQRSHSFRFSWPPHYPLFHSCPLPRASDNHCLTPRRAIFAVVAVDPSRSREDCLFITGEFATVTLARAVWSFFRVALGRVGSGGKRVRFGREWRGGVARQGWKVERECEAGWQVPPPKKATLAPGKGPRSINEAIGQLRFRSWASLRLAEPFLNVIPSVRALWFAS